MNKIAATTLFAITVTLTATLAPAAAAEKPNIVYIMSDELAYYELSCMGSPLIQTPNIDRMAEEGILFTEALAGWRNVTARPRRTKEDWAHEMENLLNTRYKDVEKVILVCDNLNTHTPGAFYQAFPPDKARALVKKIEFHYTPKHGSWLNVAENELSSMTRQCISGRRIGDIDTLREEITAWAESSNDKQRGVDWQLKIDDARIKLKSVYPQILD